MSKQKIAIVVGMSLGWKTYYKHIKAIADMRTDIDVVVIPMKPNFVSRFLTHNFLKSFNIRIMDPIFVFRRQIEKWWLSDGQYQGFDHVHFVSHLWASYFCENNILPYSITVDITHKNDKRDLGAAREVFSVKVAAAESRIIAHAVFINSLNTFAQQSLLTDYNISAKNLLLTYPSLPMDKYLVPKKSGAGKKKNILFIGNDIYRKGGDRLVQMHQKHFADIADLHIVSFEADKLGSPGKSQYFYPDITYEEIMGKLMPLADIFVLPARFELGPYAVIEAMAHALPMVTSCTAGMDYMCRNKQNGYCISPFSEEYFVEAILELLTNDVLRKKMGKESRHLAEKYFDSNITYNALIDKMK